MSENVPNNPSLWSRAKQKQEENSRFIRQLMRMPLHLNATKKWEDLGAKKPQLKRNQMQKKGKKKLSPKQKKLAQVAPPKK